MTGKCGGGNSLRWKFKGSGGGSIPMGGENVAVEIVYAVPARFRRCATFPRLARQAATNLADGVKRHILQIYKVL